MTDPASPEAPGPRSVACPCCGRRVPWLPASRFRPFCSERCRGLDLGAWATERYRVRADETGEDGGGPVPDDSA